VACRGPGTALVRVRRGRIPRARALGHRRGRSTRNAGRSRRVGSGVLRRLAARQRSDGDDQDRRRLRRHPAPPRLDRRRGGRRRGGGRRRRHDRPDGRRGGRRALRAPRGSARRRSEGLRRSADAAAAETRAGATRRSSSSAARGGDPTLRPGRGGACADCPRRREAAAGLVTARQRCPRASAELSGRCGRRPLGAGGGGRLGAGTRGVRRPRPLTRDLAVGGNCTASTPVTSDEIACGHASGGCGSGGAHRAGPGAGAPPGHSSGTATAGRLAAGCAPALAARGRRSARPDRRRGPPPTLP
jgi:hypothetical protein